MTDYDQGRESTGRGVAFQAMTPRAWAAPATTLWAKARLVAGLLVVVSAAACGGGGGVSNNVKLQPQISVQTSPSSLTFGSIVVGVTSVSQTVILVANGSGSANLTAVSVTGDFSQTNNCPSTLTSSATCTILVYFTPTQTGSRTGTLSITTSASSPAQAVSLTGTGIGLAAVVSPVSLTFGAQMVGSSSTAQNLVLSNVGTTPFNLTNVLLTGDFSITSNCPATLAAGSSCTFPVVFTPSETGTRKGSVAIFTTASNMLPTVNLAGTAINGAVQVSPGSLTFGSQTVGTTSASQPVNLANSSTSVLSVTSIAASANFGETNNCGTSVPANGSCTINVTFSPTASGPLTGTLTITDNSAGAAQTVQKVNLQGAGTVASAGFSSSVLTFPNEPTATTSAPLTETVTNTGTVNLAFSTVTIGGVNPSDFAKTADTCTGATLTPTSTCEVSATFTPSVPGSFSAALIFTDNAGGSPQTVTMSGIGEGPVASFSASALTFVNQALNTASAAQTETVTSTGTTSLAISTVSISGTNASEFGISADTCTGATMSPTGTCAVSVTFTPSVAGTQTASLNFSDNAGGSPQVVSLTGNPLPGVYTQRYDNSQSGANTQEVILTPSNVNVNQFGKLFALPVDGQVFAQPLYVKNVTIPGKGLHNVLYVATENDSVFAFDADGQSTVPLWQVSFLSPATPVTAVPCQAVVVCDINPVIGITGTPVIDPTSGILYVVAKTQEPLGASAACTSNGTYDYCYRLHALDITSGTEQLGGPVLLSASVPGTGYDSVNGVVTFGALWQLQRPGLLLLNGTVYIAFGSHGDIDPYHGWVMAYDATTLQQVAVFNTTPNSEKGAIWESGGGISADTNGNLYVVTANGGYDLNTGGVDYGDSVLKMQIQSGQFQVLDYFTPYDESLLAIDDLDLGSSPALILPTQTGTYPDQLATGGKDGRIWLLNRDNLGHFQANDAGALEVIPEIGSDSLFGGLTYWNGNLYVQEVGAPLNQFVLTNGTMPQAPSYSTELEFGAFPNYSPVVSANATSNGIVWLVQINPNNSYSPAILYAFDAADVSTELYDTTQAPNNRDQAGVYVKFVIPTVANGKVYVGTTAEVDVYGLLP